MSIEGERVSGVMLLILCLIVWCDVLMRWRCERGVWVLCVCEKCVCVLFVFIVSVYVCCLCVFVLCVCVCVIVYLL